MSVADAYRMQSTRGWTPIEILAELYSSAILSLETCREATSAGDIDRQRQASFRCQRILLAILSGIDPKHGEIATRPASLCFYALDCIKSNDYEAAIRILTVLRDAFQEAIPQLATEGQSEQDHDLLQNAIDLTA